MTKTRAPQSKAVGHSTSTYIKGMQVAIPIIMQTSPMQGLRLPFTKGRNLAAHWRLQKKGASLQHSPSGQAWQMMQALAQPHTGRQQAGMISMQSMGLTATLRWMSLGTSFMKRMGMGTGSSRMTS